MKYKVGDKVKIRKDLKVGEIYGGCRFASGMQKLVGKIACIEVVSKGNECYRIDSNHFLWTDEMFEGKVKDNINISTNGNQVIAINEETGKKGVARCHPDDEFNFYTGAKIALARLEEAETPFGWLKEGVRYYVPQLTFTDLCDEYWYGANNLDKRNLERGIIFQTKKEAIECAKKMLAVIK